MKQCAKCLQELPLTEFWVNRRRGGHQDWCKQCATKRKSDPKYKAVNAKARTAHRERYREWYQSLKDKPCSKCGTKLHPRAMHWHHRDPSTKAGNVGTMAANQVAKMKLLQEVEKCDLLCAGCHAEHEGR
jgi:hypothetical protein